MLLNVSDGNCCVGKLTQTPKNRIQLVDSLRGFALLAIIILHNLEHFDFGFKPDTLPPFIQVLDKYVWATVKFLFAGKAYAIFALLFGFSFYLMDSKQRDSGVDFRLRFLWRMLLLLGFGTLNSAIYQGDILTYYAVLGVTLVLVSRWSSRWIMFTMIVLLLQPIEIGRLIIQIISPSEIISVNTYRPFFKLSHEYLGGSSFWDVIKGNFINGRIGVVLWSWEKGRLLQAPALFMMGFLLGRLDLFNHQNNNFRKWVKIGIISLLVAIPLYFVTTNLKLITESKNLLPSLKLITNSYYNLAQMSVLVSVFVMLYQWIGFQKLVMPLSLLGRMSLTNYMMQSVLGALIYYGFGLGLYQYTGASYSLLIAVVMLLFQIKFSKWWLSKHGQGPLEYLWHKATWGFKI